MARPELRALALALAVSLTACTTALELGERRYREGDRLGALETWRAIEDDQFGYERAQQRIHEVQAEFEQLAVRYEQRARYYEEQGRLSESVLNYRLALRLQPDDPATLDHVQALVRSLATRRRELMDDVERAFARGDLAGARRAVEALHRLDPFWPETTAAEGQLESALGSEVDRLLARGRRGFTSGNLGTAQRAFEDVLALDPDNESARGYLTYIERIRTEEREITVSQRERTRTDPQEVAASETQIRAEGAYQNALAAEQAGDPYRAIGFDLAALRVDPQHARAREHLATTRARLAPEVEGLLQAGQRRFKQEDLQGALDQWRRALLIDPGNAQAREYAARAERMLENLDRLRDEPGGAGG
jgi:tetratricopeptide (TPR) repeat protein